MRFKEDKVDQFLQIFHQSKKKIRAFPGCRHLELHRDVHDKATFSTYSHWERLEDLNAYRESELFSEVWPSTKKLFREPPLAYSQVIVDGPVPND